MKNYRFFTLVVAIVLLLDQVTKIYVDSTFALYQSLPVIENFFHITYLRNPGAAFGILADSSIRLPFFISISLLAAMGSFTFSLTLSLWACMVMETSDELF